MQKGRKSSLSPCYVSSNKENIQLDNFVPPSGLSFRNLEKQRSKKTKDVAVELFPHKVQGNGSQRKDAHETEQYRSSLKSKEKQMSSLQSQVQTLTATITLLKDQLKNLKHEN